MSKLNLLPALILTVFFACKTTKQEKTISTSEETSKNKSATGVYHGSYTKYFDLIHTRLDVAPDWNNSELPGKAQILLKPHFYPTDSLVLNARGMQINSVALQFDVVEIPLEYKYKNNLILIKLDKIYTSTDSLTITIDYISKPETLPPGGSAAIRKDKGLYFINPDGTDPYKPKQLWTQGETESNSVWFPTIEDPGQRMTQEIYITVDSSLKTLSNGLNLSAINNPDGTRTDYWKQNYALPPYLSMIAVGDFAIVKDSWRGREVSYYVDKNYEAYAKMIFGITPEMMEYFSKILGVDFRWEKYSQVVVHDFVSGAMENNTAVVHGTNMQQDPRQHKDRNYEDIISHELFHHWFGNLVTCESWANITLNEGFASYGEYLWQEHKYGRDAADEFGQQDQSTYLRSTKKGDAPLIRFQFDDREDVYDAISYQKGARVLHMLRNLTGDSAFFLSLKNYLNKYQFSAVEFHQLRIEFEKVTGQDLNWFFNQWFVKSGKPSLEIFSAWNENKKEMSINLKQTQDLKKNPLFRLPMDVDFYFDNTVIRKNIILDSLSQAFVFSFPEKPKLANVDAKKMLLLQTKTENKTTEEWIFQYHHAPLFLDRYEAVDAIGKEYKSRTPAASLIIESLMDKNSGIRELALKHIKEIALNDPDQLKKTLVSLAQSDSVSIIRGDAYEALGEYYPFKEFSSMFEKAIPDYSYYVEASVFGVVAKKDVEMAFRLAEILEKDSASIVLSELASFYSEHPEKDKIMFFQRALNQSSSWGQYRIINYFTSWLKAQKLPVIREGLESIESLAERTNNRHIRNNSIASMIQVQNELSERIKEAKKSHSQKNSNQNEPKSVTIDEVDLNQLESLKEELENKIKSLEKKAI